MNTSHRLIHICFFAAFLLVAGCAKKEDPKSELSRMLDDADKLSEEIKANEAARKVKFDALAAQLKEDKQPLFDFATDTIKKELPEQVGDDNAKHAVVTANKESLKTFGPAKYTMTGHLSVKDANDKQRETTWKVTVENIGGKLIATAISLNAEK